MLYNLMKNMPHLLSIVFFLIPLPFPPNPAPHILLPSFLDIFARVGGLEEKRLLFQTFRNFFVVKILKDGAGGARFGF